MAFQWQIFSGLHALLLLWWLLIGEGLGIFWKIGSVQPQIFIKHIRTLIYLQVYPDPDPGKEYVTNSLKSAQSDNEVSEEPPVTVMSWYRQLTGITCYLLGIIVRIGLDLAL